MAFQADYKALWRGMLPTPPPGFPPVRLMQAAQAKHQERVQARLEVMQAEASRRKASQASQSKSGGARLGSAGAAADSEQAEAGLSIKVGQHWLIAGMTGVGKTYLVTSLVSRFQRSWRVPVVYMDTKGGEFDHLEGIEGIRFYRQQEPPPWPLPDGVAVAVWTPERDHLPDYEAFLATIKASKRRCIIVIDELSSLGKEAADTFVPSLGILLKQGRALKITLFVLTQELARIPRTVLRQTTHLALMMNDPADPQDFDTMRAAKLGGLPPVTVPRAFNYRSRLEPHKRWRYDNVQQLLGLSRKPGKTSKPKKRQR